MRVLVTGGTGFVGRQIVQELVRDGAEVRVLARSPAPAIPGAQFFPGTIGDLDLVTRALASMDAVVHLVGIIAEVGDQTFEKIHVQGADTICNAARASGVRRLIHMSALGTGAGASSRYHQTKWMAEEIVRGSGLEATIFRPSVIYGPDDNFVNLFARMMRYWPVVPVMGSGEGTLQPVPVGIVARAFSRAVLDPKSAGETYDLAGPEVLTFNEVLDKIMEVTGRRRMKVHLPLPLARGMAGILEKIFSLLGKKAPLNRDQVSMLQEKTIGDAAAANRRFHLEPPPFRAGLSDFLKSGR